MSGKDDYISRRAAIDAMTNTLWHYPNWCYQNLNEYEFAKGLAELGLKSVPSAQPEIINCFECVYYKPISNSWGKCYIHSSRTERYRTCQFCDYCSWAERKTE